MKEKGIEIHYNLIEIKKISHSENDYSEYGLTEDDIKTLQSKVELLFAPLPDEECLEFIVNSNIECVKDKKTYNLFEMRVLYKFKIKDFKKAFEGSEKKNIKIPDQFLQVLVGMVISGARGIQAVLITNPAYKKVLIPIINTKNTIEGLKSDLENRDKKDLVIV